ncbi:MAG: quinolinate synthase NadA, partial [Nitrospinota bacterium]|nr:quinolinate synthase NadA [Nitrospinota bacterium]
MSLIAEKTTELQQEIRRLVKERNAVMLAHNYQRDEIQQIADIGGDSLALSMEAARTDAEVILFCGVHFMAESAAILSPDKTVLLPHIDAGCPMADMITPEKLREKRAELGPDIPVVTYVNSSAEVKAESDICCTSANAVAVVNSLPGDRVFMTPDMNLAKYVARHTKKKVDWWKGFCPTHHQLK